MDTLDTTTPLRGTPHPDPRHAAPPAEPASAVAWGAILAGAAGAAALTLILAILGVGLGMASVSPWSGAGAGAMAVGWTTIAWTTFTAVVASGMGGYLAGRLRTRWTAVHGDEVYFRDTAHGFLAWAVASLATAALLGSALGAIASGAAQAGAAVAEGAGRAVVGGAGGRAGDAAPGPVGMGYAVDSLLRRGAPAASPAGGADATATSGTAGTADPAAPPVDAAPGSAPAVTAPATATAAAAPAPTAEVGRILANGLRAGSLGADDTRYLGGLVAQRSGSTAAEGERRVTVAFGRLQAGVRDAETAARDAADKARKAAAYGSLWLFVSLLAGAFVASWAATYGGRRRDA